LATNPRFATRDSDIPSNLSDKFDLENLKTSTVSEKIYIDGNSGWAAFKAAGNCTGNGTYADPYVIEDRVIDGEYYENSIFINNSNVYFKIMNCSLYNSRNISAGIRLQNVNNSQLIDNYCTSNYYGIYLRDSNNNTISGNIQYENYYGIYLTHSDYNDISGNNANNNSYTGIFINRCRYNNISTNTVNYNFRGIFTHFCYNTIVSHNIANGNGDDGITIMDSNNNTISGNIANDNAYIGFMPRELIYTGITVRGDNNIISGNTANNNQYGIYLYDSNYNIVSGNFLIGNNACIVEDNCYGNQFSDNGDCTYGQGEDAIPGYNFFLLLGILSVVAILIGKKVKKL
jgi:parallel beta-helix repeat protein